MIDKFPKNFLFGTSTSAHQVEGHNHNDWTEWEKLNAAELAYLGKKRFKKLPSWENIKNAAQDPENYISGIAVDHWNRYEEDLELAEELGTNAYRFSIEWSRVEPEKGKWDQEALDHYRKMIASMKAHGLEPFLTVWHWTLPIWLSKEGGVASKHFPEYISRYAEKLTRSFGNEVKYWLTLNEPELYAWNSYFRGVWPPNKDNPLLYNRVFKNLAAAHSLMHKSMKAVDPKAEIGYATNQTVFESAGGKWNDWLFKKADKFWNDRFLDKVSKDLDFIGLNYYFHNRINFWFNRNSNERISDLGWELYPRGLEAALKKLADRKKPIYITENGLADQKDENRTWFLRESLNAVRRAIKEGVDVRGYFHWSLLDNFEWDKGFWPRFGLIEVNRKTLNRTVRGSGRFYHSIIKEN